MLEAIGIGILIIIWLLARRPSRQQREDRRTAQPWWGQR
jgi:hypothetical protein